MRPTVSPLERGVVPDHRTEGKASPMARVLIVGGPDVRKRGDLMQALVDRFEVAAAGSEPRDAEHLAGMGFSFHYYPMARGSTPGSDLQTCIALYRLYRQLTPDIVHTFATKPCVWGRVAARLAGVPIVIGTLPGLGSLYSADDLKRRTLKRIYEALQRSASRLSDLTIFQNSRDAGELTDAGVVPIERSLVIPGSGVRTEVFDRARISPEEARSLRSELGVPEGAVLVTMISRIIRSKGVLVFAEAAHRVRESADNVRFLLVGPDDQHSVDRLTNEELAYLSGSVTWLGERKDIRCILAATDVFTLPTFYREGIPRVLLEAASMRLPLVATQRPGCEDVIPEGRNGFLVPVRDSAALAEAILKLIRYSDLRERFARESRRIAVTQFDVQRIARRTARLYEDLLRKQAGRDLGGRVRPPVREGANGSEYPSVRARSGREQQRDKHSRATTTPVQPG